MEQDRTVWKPMTPQDGAVTCSQSLKCSDFFGKGNLVGAEGYTGTAIADPTEEIFYEVWAARANKTTHGVAELNAFCCIEYDVQFSQPKALGES